MKIKLKGRTSPEQVGTVINHFGIPFTVQKDKSFIADVDEEIAKMQLDAGRVVKVEENNEAIDSRNNDQNSVKNESNQIDEAEITEDDLRNMQKHELIVFAKDNFNVDLDEAKKKNELIEEILSLSED